MVKVVGHFHIFKVTCEFLDLKNFINRRFDVKLSNGFPKLARLKLCHPKDILDMKQQEL